MKSASSFCGQLTEKLICFRVRTVEGDGVNGDWVQQLYLGQDRRRGLKDKEVQP